ncbi:MAG: dihydropteroate synthase [Acidobacteria bacterium]|nr:dihydropteroate synthase [Acidobacteriota bacterium]
MGILNVTPDSFADGGRGLDPGRAVEDAVEMAEQGADIIDVGGESTRPGAEPVPADEEKTRVLPVLRGLAARVRIPISIDTYKAEVARAAIAEGAVIVNDVSGLRYDPHLGQVVATSGVGLVLMHLRGRPRDMYREAAYTAIVEDVRRELDSSIQTAVEAGVALERVLIDPGLGFAKRAGQTFEVLAALPEFRALGRPIVVGPSRKSFLQQAIGERPPDRRDWGTAAAVAASVLLGAHIVRVHAVAEMTQVVEVADRLRRSSGQ